MTKFDIAKRKKELNDQIDYAENRLKANLVSTFEKPNSILGMNNIVPLGIDMIALIPKLAGKLHSPKIEKNNSSNWFPWVTVGSWLFQWYFSIKDENESEMED